MNSLNREQKRAVHSGKSIVCVIAGAGTGKTKTLIQKVYTLIHDKNIPAEQILVLTFSRKAADEIKDRISIQSCNKGSGISTGTFHSFSLQILRTHCCDSLQQFGFTGFPDIISDEVKAEYIRSEIRKHKELFCGLPVTIIESMVFNEKRFSPFTTGKLNKSGITSALSIVRKNYSEYKIRKNLIDYEDMIQYTNSILENNTELRGIIQKKFKYILIDEFQDTSENNMRLIKNITPSENPGLFVVGDDWQSIYAFRNARVDYIINLKKYFPNSSTITLYKNYRSRQEIVSLSNKFIKHNKIRTKKNLKSAHGTGGTIKTHSCQTRDTECRIIAEIVRNNLNGDTAILYRNNWQGKYITEFLVKEFGDRITDTLQLMTMHASKGLEFNTVIITGISDKILPDPSSDIEEERRLMYVALTRAKETLHIVHYLQNENKLSKFARELQIRK